MQNVSRQLGELQVGMRQLVESSRGSSHPPSNSSPATAAASQDSPSTHINGGHPDVSVVFEGYKGDSSFDAHVKDFAGTLEGTFGAAAAAGEPSIPSAIVHNLLQDADAAERFAQESADFSRANLNLRYPELENLPLPSTQPVLRLLRLAQTEKQRFFADVPFVDEQAFINDCKSVYFATEPYSLWAWITVNIGLLYLFLDLGNNNYAQVGVSAVDIEKNVRLLSGNADAACQCLRLCLEPSIPACRAITLLGVFCTKTGRSTIAWRLIGVAAQMCLDLGLHRIPNNAKGEQTAMKHALFWHVYAFDKGMAFTNGRTPAIHHYDVVGDRPNSQQEYPGIPGLIYAVFIEWTAVAGEIHMQLFSISAQQQPLSVRVERAKSFANRMLHMQKALRASQHGDPDQSALTFQGALRIMDIMAHGYLTIVYRIIPAWQAKAHPLQCCDECVDAARKALSTLVQCGERKVAIKPIWWSLFLNTTLSVVPFVSFVVIVGHAVATSSTEDLALLSSVVSIIKPAVEHTPATQKLCNVCQKFYQIAELILSQQLQAIKQPVRTADPGAPSGLTDVDLPMSEQDWDAVMQGFDLELDGLDAGAMATFVEPYVMSEPAWGS